MAHDKGMEARIDLLSLNWPGFAKKKMFGGVGYVLNGNMAFAGEDVMLGWLEQGRDFAATLAAK